MKPLGNNWKTNLAALVGGIVLVLSHLATWIDTNHLALLPLIPAKYRDTANTIVALCALVGVACAKDAGNHATVTTTPAQKENTSP